MHDCCLIVPMGTGHKASLFQCWLGRKSLWSWFAFLQRIAQPISLQLLHAPGTSAGPCCQCLCGAVCVLVPSGYGSRNLVATHLDQTSVDPVKDHTPLYQCTHELITASCHHSFDFITACILLGAHSFCSQPSTVFGHSLTTTLCAN